MGRERLNVNGRVDDPCGSGGGSRAVVRRIREAIVVTLLRTVIGGGGVAVCPGVDGIRGARGGGVMEGWRGVGGGRGVVVARVEGTISGWMGTAEEGRFGHPAMVDGRIRGGVEGG